MGVKKLLEKQDAGFISLHDLLLEMTKAGDGCTLQEAATALCSLLRNTDRLKRPILLNKTDMRGLTLASRDLNSSAMYRLQYVAKNGEWEESDALPF